MAKIYCHSVLSGSSWSSFPELDEDDEPEAIDVDKNNTTGPGEPTRLRYEDMDLSGLCPARDHLILCVCSECNRVVKPVALVKHCEIHHPNLLPTKVPSPEPVSVDSNDSIVESLLSQTTTCIPVVVKQPDIKLERLDIEDITVKIEEVPLTVPHVNNILPPENVVEKSPSKTTPKKSNQVENKKGSNKKSPRKVIPTREREFDPNRHCGVWVEVLQKRCTRSLTCKTHALSLRRAVPGRRKAFDVLLQEHRDRVNSEKELQNSANQESVIIPSISNRLPNRTVELPLLQSRANLQAKATSFEEPLSSEGSTKPSTASSSDGTSETIMGEVPYLNYHPKPMVVCSFGARQAGPGCYMFTRKSDHFRTAVIAMVERYLNPALPRNPVKTVGQSSSQGSFTTDDKTCKTQLPNQFTPSANILRTGHSKNKTSRNVVHGALQSRPQSLGVYQAGSKRTIDHNSPTQSKKICIDNSIASNDVNNQKQLNYTRTGSGGKSISNMGNIVAGLDTKVANGVVQGGAESFKNSKFVNMNLNSSLNSSLTLCSTMGIGSPSPGGGTATSLGGMTRNTKTIVNNSVTGNVKDIFPARAAGRTAVTTVPSTTQGSVTYYKKGVQITTYDPSTGQTVVSNVAGQRKQTTVASPLSNGTGPSPPPNVNIKSYQVNYASQGGAGNKAGAKNQNVVFTTSGVQSQTVTQQPRSPWQQPQSPMHPPSPAHPMSPIQPMSPRQQQLAKGTFNRPQQKTPPPTPQGKPTPLSPSQQLLPQQQSPQQQTQQQNTIIHLTQQPNQQPVYLNHQHIGTSSQQPIAQLKHQVEQQQLQLQQITMQQQIQQQQQKQQQMNSSLIKQQVPIQPRLAPAPTLQQTALRTQQPGQTLLLKQSDAQIRGNPVYITTEQRVTH